MTDSRPYKVSNDLQQSDVDNALLLAFTRLEAKVDVALAQHGADIKSHGETLADHETRIRGAEAQGADIKAQGEDLTDHEARLREVETRPTVSPKALWTSVASASGLIIGVLTLIAKIGGF